MCKKLRTIFCSFDYWSVKFNQKTVSICNATRLQSGEEQITRVMFAGIVHWLELEPASLFTVA